MTDFGELGGKDLTAARDRGLDLHLNVSTIMPLDSAEVDISDALLEQLVRLYWSLYSLNPGFRRRWMPRAQDPEVAAARLAAWQARIVARKMKDPHAMREIALYTCSCFGSPGL